MPAFARETEHQLHQCAKILGSAMASNAACLLCSTHRDTCSKSNPGSMATHRYNLLFFSANLRPRLLAVPGNQLVFVHRRALLSAHCSDAHPASFPIGYFLRIVSFGTPPNTCKMATERTIPHGDASSIGQLCVWRVDCASLRELSRILEEPPAYLAMDQFRFSVAIPASYHSKIAWIDP